MRAELLEEADAPFRVAEGHQVLTQEPHPDGWAIGCGQFGGEQRRDPVAPDRAPHRRAGFDARNELVLFVGQHGVFLPAERFTAERPPGNLADYTADRPVAARRHHLRLTASPNAAIVR